MQLFESKSILAKLMATENLIVEQRPVRTASFDVANRILTLPILNNEVTKEVYDLFVGHEVGHALYTPEEGMRKAMKAGINMGIVNIVEDSRIERKIKYKYPGLRYAFSKAYKELEEKNFFETLGKNINEYNLIDRINLHCKIGATQIIDFTDEERLLLDEVQNTETYDDVITVSKKLMDLMVKQEKEKIKIKQKDEQGENGEDDNQQETIEIEIDAQAEAEKQKDSVDEESTDDGQSIESKPHGGSQGGDKEEVEDIEQNAQMSAESEQKKNQTQIDEEKIKSQIKSQTDEAFKRRESELYAALDQDYYYGNIPKIELKRAILDYKDLYSSYKRDGHQYDHVGFTTLRRETNKVTSYLVKEFELRKNADQLKRALTAKTGELNMNKIYSYQFSEDLFKKMTIIPGAKSHGLVMFIDWSGSMSNHIHNTVKQLISLVMFCKKVNIPFEVYAFADGDYQTAYKARMKAGDILVRDFVLLNIFSSRMNAKEFNEAGAAMFFMSRRPGYCPSYMGMQGTPLNECIIAAMELIPDFRNKYKLQNVNAVFLTDGDGDSVRSVIEYNEKSGSYDSHTPSRFSGKDYTFVIRDPVTKNQVLVKESSKSKNQTEAYIQLLKDRTGCNVLGFYLLATRELPTVLAHYMKDYSNFEISKQKFKKDKSLVVTNAGFDEYYLLKSDSLDTSDSEFDIEESASTRKLVSAFSKYTGGRVASRVILNRFIGMIT